ncbi:MAG: glycoside hydrolase family 15, partial [Candidatus Omnitrophica bacterium]|nr:glycoside hydrolase family 15 [Candidatus Omnitrophota bacterium]
MYKKISEHGIIGDMHSVALVCGDGTIDYCCMPHIDSPTVFASILDEEKGGSFRISPAGNFESRQEYVDRTNILRCVFRTENAEAHLLDMMPVKDGKGADKKEHSIHRYLRMKNGKMAFELEISPRPDYARDIPEIRREGQVFRISGGKADLFLKTDVRGLEVRRNEKGRLLCGFTLEEGEEAVFCFVSGKEPLESADVNILKDTRRFWRGWLGGCVTGQCSLSGEHDKMTQRSLLVLKLLTFKPTGAIAAAATMSLPECIGGSRNWDYRFTWLRDASFTLKALFGRGYIEEAERFVNWLNGVYSEHGSDNTQIMYSLQGESDLKETELEHLEGYRGSRPVREGNAAYAQNQWDIYGEIMDTALRLSDYAGKIDERMWPFFRRVCGLAVENWREPDHGIWEDRSGPHHFVYSKVMCWVALDRGLKIASRYG